MQVTPGDSCIPTSAGGYASVIGFRSACRSARSSSPESQLCQQRFPLAEGAIQVRNQEVVVSVNNLATPFSAVSQIEEALTAL